ncbi:MAG: D-glycerate dehydrogenase [Phycisphaerae bacterium]|jgi:glyoxylate reductase
MRVLITRQLPSAAAETLRRAGHDVLTLEDGEPAPRAEVLARLPGCAGVITLLSDRVDDEFLDAAGPGLLIVANFAVGFDNIDLEACRRRGVFASNTPDVLTNATADLAWALILAAARRVVEGDRLVRSGAWRGWAPLQLLGLELCGATLGIVGAGRIGSAVARRAAGFEMRILYYDPRRNEALEQQTGARPAELADLLRASDVVTLHAPMCRENRHLIGEPQLAMMKPTAILVNTARGPLVDEAALLTALREGRIAAAGLDVYEFEPQVSAGLAEQENVVLLPHLGSATVAARERMAALAAENVVAALAGREPPNRVA